MRLVDHPILCNYYLTYRCNAKCDFCDIWEKPSPYVDTKSFTENLNDLKQLGVRVIDFTGGEPLLHQGLPELLSIAKELGFITTVTTNGLLYPKMAKKLKGKIDMLHFSLDSPDRETHNKLRGVDCFDHVMESIEVAKKLGERPDILFTVFPENLHEIQEVYNNISLPNDLMMLLNPVFAYNEVETHGEDFSNSQLDQLSGWAKRPLVYLNEGFIELRKNGGNQIKNPVCKAASSTIVISPSNELVLPCYHLDDKKIPIDGNLKAVYQSDEVDFYKKNEGKLPGCQGCTINCYMQPSFAVSLNRYWVKALPSTLKYNWVKKTYKSLFSL